jgi:multiple sugar transport system substrate-binding protein
LGTYDVEAGQVAPRQDIVDVPAYHSTPLNPFYTSLVAFTQFRPGFPAYPKISLQIDAAMQHVMSGQSPSDAMSSFTQAVTGIAGASNVEQKT